MKYLVTGGSGGLGKAVVQELKLHNQWHEGTITTMGREGCDISCDFADFYPTYLDGISPDVVIHCAGVNRIKPHPKISRDDLYELLEVNALSQFTINRILLERGVRTICHIISDAAWTPMTHSLAYNISKAAQLMVMRQMAHEDKRAIIFGISPGKIASTGMSRYIDETFPALRNMTYDEGRAYQLSRLKTGEMSPKTVAKFIVYHALNANKHYHGQNFCIGG